MDLYSFLSDNYVLVFGILLCLFFLIEEEISSYMFGSFRIDPEDLLNMQNKGAVLHDIRDRTSYQSGHISKAKHNFVDILQDKPETVLDKKNKHILYCTNGSQSFELVSMLRSKRGFDVYYLYGGLDAWSAESFTLTKE